MKSYCSNCNKPTNQKVLKEVVRKTKDEVGWWDESRFQIIKCGGCDEITFRKLYDDIYRYSEGDTESKQELFPNRGMHIRPRQSYRGVPFKIRIIYDETIDTFNSFMPILCGIGVRAIVESICQDKNINEGKVMSSNGKEHVSKNLDGKISGLLQRGFLTPHNADTLHELRFLGNKAAHEIKPPTIEELGIAIDIIENIIENIYLLTRKAESLKARRVK